RDIQIAIQRLYMQRRVAQMAPCSWVGLDENGNYRCLSWLVIDSQRVVRVTSGMHAQQFPAVCKSELVSMLAMFDLFEQLKQALGGHGNVAVSHAVFEREKKSFESKLEMASISISSCGVEVENVLSA